MKFAVVGAGAIGAFAGALLSRAGNDVTLIARGANLKTIRERGVRIHGGIGEITAHPSATDNIADVGAVDVVLLATKAHSLTEIAPQLAPLFGPQTAVIPAQNGIPWWYFYRHGGELEGLHLESVDPGSVIEKHIEPSRVIGCVVYVASVIIAPGVIRHEEGTRFSLGEPDGSKSDRCRAISESFIRAGMKSPVRTDIRHEIWVKLMGNVAFNPISALSRATLLEIVSCPETRALSADIMRECESLAKKLGIDLAVTIEQRIAGAEKVGHHKTSMLQDVEAGKVLELEPMVGAIVELGERLGVPTPYTRTVYACAKLLNEKLKPRPAGS
ncbi:MAG TPA: 2-dehydropantoate 2-reductase [Blastocatellia bacterium]|nr:2-dehydropantoate 2-reductase [Blastocatellia bacterium]